MNDQKVYIKINLLINKYKKLTFLLFYNSSSYYSILSLKKIINAKKFILVVGLKEYLYIINYIVILTSNKFTAAIINTTRVNNKTKSDIFGINYSLFSSDFKKIIFLLFILLITSFYPKKIVSNKKKYLIRICRTLKIYKIF